MIFVTGWSAVKLQVPGVTLSRKHDSRSEAARRDGRDRDRYDRSCRCADVPGGGHAAQLQ